MALSHDGQLLATSGVDSEVAIWLCQMVADFQR